MVVTVGTVSYEEVHDLSKACAFSHLYSKPLHMVVRLISATSQPLYYPGATGLCTVLNSSFREGPFSETRE